MRKRGTAIVLREGKILLVKDAGKHRFSLPGGKVNKGEPPLAAAIRELYEELGMRAFKAERLFHCDFKGSFSAHKVCLIETRDNPVLKSEELDAFHWWDMKEEVPRFQHVDYVVRHLAGIIQGRSPIE